MKKILLSLLAVAIAMAAQAGVEINTTNFPDDKFRSKVREYDINDDNYLSDAELATVTQMYARYSGIRSFEGIKYFTALEELHAMGNASLTAIDMSHNLALKVLEVDVLNRCEPKSGIRGARLSRYKWVDIARP